MGFFARFVPLFFLREADLRPEKTIPAARLVQIQFAEKQPRAFRRGRFPVGIRSNVAALGADDVWLCSFSSYVGTELDVRAAVTCWASAPAWSPTPAAR